MLQVQSNAQIRNRKHVDSLEGGREERGDIGPVAWVYTVGVDASGSALPPLAT